MSKRHLSWIAPLAAAIIAGVVVAAVSLGSTSSPRATSSGANGASTSGVAGAQKTVAGVPSGALAYQNAVVRVVKMVSPSVVQIETPSGLGSGIVFDNKGDIVTNAHVVGTPPASQITVTTPNAKILKATVVGTFPPDDLAVIKVTGGNLKPAAFADSSKLRVGDLAIAIGNPLGLSSSVTDGIVSALGRNVSEPNGYTLPSVIQTSAAINPGNSGGALVDIAGKVIGIPTLAATDPQLGGGSAPGIGFAIPSNLVKDIAGQIVAHGRVVNSHRAYLGVQIGETGGNGVYVGAVEQGGPAAKAGMQVGDVIVSIAGKKTPTVQSLSDALIGLKPGQKVPVVVAHQNGTQTTLQVTLGTYPGGS